MKCSDMILDSVSVANLDEVILSDMVASGVNFPEFTCLDTRVQGGAGTCH